MDLLKYIDVLIGLTVVMILLSPAVTAVTQLFMFVFNRRSSFLRKGLANLIQQLDGAPVEQWTVPGAAGAQVQVTGRTANRLTVQATTAAGAPVAAGQNITLTLMPRNAQTGERFESDLTTAAGVATVKYAHIGPSAFTGDTATVTVLNRTPGAAAAPVAGAHVACVIKTGPDANTPVALAGNTFTYPVATRPAPPQYEIECTVTDAAGTALSNHVVRFDFDRTDTFDWTQTVQVVAGLPTVFNLPPVMNPENAQTIASAVLLHPMICKVGFSLGFLTKLAVCLGNVRVIGPRVRWLDQKTSRDPSGEVVEREELTRILLEFAASEGAGKLNDVNARTALIQSLKMNGIPDPSKALAGIRAEAQRLEKDEPEKAAHVRAAEAIITAAKSDYVGRINDWFDQTMDRVTQRYGMQARVVTVLAALLVALSIQVDSLDLLRRLSVDDKLRESLLHEAKDQQERIDQLAKNQQQNKDELDVAKASRDEMQANLAKLRSPQMAILPDHFIWQQVPQARLVRNPMWRATYPAKFELVLGSTSYTITPRWHRDPLLEIKDAIDESKAPVSTEIKYGEAAKLLTAKKAYNKGLNEKKNVLTPVIQLASARLWNNPTWPDNVSVNLRLMLDDRAFPDFPVNVTRDSVITTVRMELDKNNAISLSTDPDLCGAKGNPDCTSLRITALDPRVRQITLRYDPTDPFSNVLSDTERITRAGTALESDLGHDPLPNVEGKAYKSDTLVLTSHRLGALELRYTTGKPETNVLDKPVAADWATIGWRLLEPSLWGVVLTWILLSLGAPFWYDRLKDLLKLRSSVASKEEAQRTQRQEQQPKT